MEEALEKGKESSNFAHANGMNERMVKKYKTRIYGNFAVGTRGSSPYNKP